MRITLNGEPRELGGDALSLGDALGLLSLPLDARGVAVAVDGAVVPRSAWARTSLAEGQRVEVLTAVQGGAR
jgi:sulfur carrier protein